MKNYVFAPFLFSPLSSPSSEGKFKMCKNFLFITPVKNKDMADITGSLLMKKGENNTGWK